MNRVSRNWSSRPRVCGKFLPLLPWHKGCPSVPRGCQDEEMEVSVLGHPNSTWQFCFFHPFPPLSAARLEVPTAPGCCPLWFSGFPCFVYSCSRCAALGRSPYDVGTQVSPVPASHAQR